MSDALAMGAVLLAIVVPLSREARLAVSSDRLAYLVQRISRHFLDVLDLMRRQSWSAMDQASGELALQRDHRQAVPQKIVQVSSEAQTLLTACRERLRGVPVLEQVVTGEPTIAIAEACEAGDLVTLRAADPWEGVLREARCPVLVVG